MSAPDLRHSEQPKFPPGSGTQRRCFTVIDGDEMFGLPVESVQTIFRIEGVTPVPLGPPEVEGLVNLRGRIVTAVSLKRRLSKTALQSVQGALAIGIEHNAENFALIVDEVGDVITCEASAQIPPPPHIDALRAKLTSEHYRLDGRILPILDMDAIFDFTERSRSNGSAHLNPTIIRSDQ
jgi:purine-binding chemotaxis protein CheW